MSHAETGSRTSLAEQEKSRHGRLSIAQEIKSFSVRSLSRGSARQATHQASTTDSASAPELVEPGHSYVGHTRRVTIPPASSQKARESRPSSDDARARVMKFFASSADLVRASFLSSGSAQRLQTSARPRRAIRSLSEGPWARNSRWRAKDFALALSTFRKTSASLLPIRALRVYRSHVIHHRAGRIAGDQAFADTAAPKKLPSTLHSDEGGMLLPSVAARGDRAS